MTDKADMIILIKPGVLEFSAKGKTLMRVGGLGARAAAIFAKVRKADTKEQRQWLITNAYRHFSGGENV
jgi:hypothetical protein